jgi:hypothetical protein
MGRGVRRTTPGDRPWFAGTAKRCQPHQQLLLSAQFVKDYIESAAGRPVSRVRSLAGRHGCRPGVRRNPPVGARPVPNPTDPPRLRPCRARSWRVSSPARSMTRHCPLSTMAVLILVAIRIRSVTAVLLLFVPVNDGRTRKEEEWGVNTARIIAHAPHNAV